MNRTEEHAPQPDAPSRKEPDVQLADLLDMPALQALMDDFHALTGFGVGIIDLNGIVRVATGWQDICTKFHRVHPETCQHCIESDALLSSGVELGTFKRARCQNNMWDISTPIVVDNRHVGNLFLGQFFFDNEQPDVEVFRAQARRYGFDEADYLAALDRVPRWSREKVDRVMAFYAKFATLISEMGYRNLQLTRALADQTRAEKQLERSYALLQLAGKTALFGGWIVHLADRRVVWSDEVAAIHDMPAGHSPATTEEGISFYAPEWRDRIARALGDCAAQGVSFDEDMEILTAKGRRRWVRTTGVAVRDTYGRIVQVQGSFQDITERKQAEEKLRESHALFSLFMRHSPIYTFIKEVTATESRVLVASENYQQMIGLPGSRMAGKTMAELFPPEFAAKITADDWAVVAKGEVLKLEEELAGRHYTTIKFPIVREGKALLAGYTIDITEQKQAEEQVRLHAQLLDSVTESVVATDLDGRILYWSHGAEQLYGYTAAETLGKPYRDFAGAADPPDEPGFRRELLATGSWRGEHLQKNRNGDRFWTSTVISLVKNSQGQPAGFIGIDQDISARKQAEEAVLGSQARFAALFDASPVGLMLVERDTRLISQVNAAASALIGRPPDQIAGQVCHGFMCPAETSACPVCDLGQTLDRSERILRKADGTQIPILKTVVPVQLDGKHYLLESFLDISERKQTEERLKASEDRFRLLVKNSSDIIAVVDAGGILQYVSAAEKAVSGFTAEEVTGRTIQEMVHPDDIERTLLEFQTAIAHPEQIRRVQCRHRHKTGGWVDVEIIGQSFLDDPSVGGVVINVRDTTERKRTEDRLRTSAEQYRDLAANIPGVIYQLQTGRTGMLEVPYMSAGCEALFERPLADQTYTGLLFDHMHLGDRSLFQHSLAAAARQQERWSLEFRILRPDGRIKWLRGSANPRLLPNGALLWNGVLLDIDELKQAEEARRESENFQRLLMDTLPTPVFYKDRKGRYLLFNKAFESFFGKSKEEMTGQSVFDLVPSELATVYQAKDMELFAKPGIQTFESQLTDAQGALRDVVFRKASITDAHGVVIGLIGIIHDITDRKQAEQQMTVQLDELRRWYAVTLGREKRIAELKREVNAMAARLGQPPPYGNAEAGL